MLQFLFGIENLDNFIRSLYALMGVLIIFLVYRRIFKKVQFLEKEMDRLYRELWTKIKSESADPHLSIIVVNSRISHLKEEYAKKIDHLETKRDFILKRVPFIDLLYKKRREKEKQKRATQHQ